MVPGRKEEIAELYYRTGSIKFGSFKLSIHKDHPELPDSPWYLHYPKEGEPGSELLPELHELVGAEFYDMAESQSPPVRPKRIAGLPRGALDLADAFASHYDTYPKNLVIFEKEQYGDGRTEFKNPEGNFEVGDNLVACEDHISGGRNNRLFAKSARKCGFVVTKLFVVVDRQQGGVENMAAEGVELLSIFTADDLLNYGLGEGHITSATFKQVLKYRAENQFSLSRLSKS